MAESAELRDEAVPRAARPEEASPPPRALRQLKRGLARSIFWAYERGTWQYDIIVVVILAFIFLPRSWFGDRPQLQLSALRHIPGVVEVSHGKNWGSYEIDARLVESVPHENPEVAAREILGRNLRKPFTVKSVDVIRDKNNVVLGYMVLVEFEAIPRRAPGSSGTGTRSK